MLDPFAGMYVSSSYDGEGSGDDGIISGTAVGVRFGFTKMGFSFGFDGRRQSLSLEPKDTDLDKSEYTITQLSLMAGYELPIMLRFWGAYTLSGTGVDNDDSDNKLAGGTGVILGAGYKALPFLSLNLEWSNLKFTEVEDATGESDYETKTQSLLLSVSIPLVI